MSQPADKDVRMELQYFVKSYYRHVVLLLIIGIKAYAYYYPYKRSLFSPVLFSALAGTLTSFFLEESFQFINMISTKVHGK